MIDNMNDITEFSPFGGELIEEEVKGTLNTQYVPENGVEVCCGEDRTMFSYIPASGCPDAKQCQVVMVLREGTDRQSAYELMKQCRLDELAEEKHVILLFPNKAGEHWNYAGDEKSDEDIEYLIRCFAALPGGKGKVAGFNGMIFYIAQSQETSAMLLTMAVKSPVNTAGIMISSLPENYRIPEAVRYLPQVAYVCRPDAAVKNYFRKVNETTEDSREEKDGVFIYSNAANPNIRHIFSEKDVTAEEIRKAWNMLFSETRRWRNDTYGTYQKRTNFTERGFEAHVRDTGLGVNENFEHTWYEYVPPQLRGSREKVPLLIYFHGIGCVPLYGAEQSGWHDIADRENFIVVYPKPSIEKRWNVWDEPSLPSDVEFILELLRCLKQKYEIDETRVYLSGFSMGSMMTNAMACSYPELFAACAPCNGPHLGYLSTIREALPMLAKMNPKTILTGMCDQLSAQASKTAYLADQKKAQQDFRMPLIQNMGLLDGKWPVQKADDIWIRTFDYWKTYNHIPVQKYEPDLHFESGLLADENFYEGKDERFLHHRWFSKDGENLPLYEVVFAKRMPHALDLRQIEIAWDFMKKFSRHQDGALHML